MKSFNEEVAHLPSLYQRLIRSGEAMHAVLRWHNDRSGNVTPAQRIFFDEVVHRVLAHDRNTSEFQERTTHQHEAKSMHQKEKRGIAVLSSGLAAASVLSKPSVRALVRPECLSGAATFLSLEPLNHSKDAVRSESHLLLKFAELFDHIFHNYYNIHGTSDDSAYYRCSGASLEQTPLRRSVLERRGSSSVTRASYAWKPAAARQAIVKSAKPNGFPTIAATSDDLVHKKTFNDGGQTESIERGLQDDNFFKPAPWEGVDRHHKINGGVLKGNRSQWVTEPMEAYAAPPDPVAHVSKLVNRPIRPATEYRISRRNRLADSDNKQPTTFFRAALAVTTIKTIRVMNNSQQQLQQHQPRQKYKANGPYGSGYDSSLQLSGYCFNRQAAEAAEEQPGGREATEVSRLTDSFGNIQIKPKKDRLETDEQNYFNITNGRTASQGKYTNGSHTNSRVYHDHIYPINHVDKDKAGQRDYTTDNFREFHDNQCANASDTAAFQSHGERAVMLSSLSGSTKERTVGGSLTEFREYQNYNDNYTRFLLKRYQAESKKKKKKMQHSECHISVDDAAFRGHNSTAIVERRSLSQAVPRVAAMNNILVATTTTTDSASVPDQQLYSSTSGPFNRLVKTSTVWLPNPGLSLETTVETLRDAVLSTLSDNNARVRTDTGGVHHGGSNNKETEAARELRRLQLRNIKKSQLNTQSTPVSAVFCR